MQNIFLYLFIILSFIYVVYLLYLENKKSIQQHIKQEILDAIDGLTDYLIRINSENKRMESKIVDIKLLNAYNTLGLPFNTNINDTRKKYYELCKLYHPDINNSATVAMFVKIDLAYKYILSKK